MLNNKLYSDMFIEEHSIFIRYKNIDIQINANKNHWKGEQIEKLGEIILANIDKI